MRFTNKHFIYSTTQQQTLTNFMMKTHKENIGIKPKLRFSANTTIFNPSQETNSFLSELLVSQNQPSKEANEKKSLGKKKLNLKSSLFSLESTNNQNTGTSDSDGNIIKSSLQADESIQESTKIDSTKQQEEETHKEMPPHIEQKEETVPIKEVQIEVTIWMTRSQFAEAVKNLSMTLKDKQIEAIEEYKKREIITEILPEPEPRPNGYRKYYQNKKPKEDIAANPTFIRDTVNKEVKKEGMIQRIELTEEERLWKEKLSNSAAKTWLTGKRTEVDPEEALKKEIKFNLNLLTQENFEKIKEVILNIACQREENCQKLAEILVENAWTQKKYMSTYAKLCAFLGRQVALEYNSGKNVLKLRILNHIQTVFEEEGQKEANETKDAKKRRFLGNISFIGELFLEKFLPVMIVRIVTSSFLKKFLCQYHQGGNKELHEETLEGLILFYDIIGKALEEKEASMKKNNKKTGDEIVTLFKRALVNGNSKGTINDEEISTDKVFKILDVILQGITLTPRLDSLVKNLKYRKDNGWVASLNTQQGPKTFKELHEEYEKEKIEEEKRGEEYRHELKSSSSSYKGGKEQKVYKSEPVFQVNNTSKKDQRNSQIQEEISAEIKPGMFGRPKRPNRNPQQQQLEQVKMTSEEIERDLKEIYNNKEMKQLNCLIKKAGSQEVLGVYLKTFFDGRWEAVKERYFIHKTLFETIPKEEFLKRFMERANQLYEISCDFPGLEKHSATVLLDYCQKTDGRDVIDGIAFDEEFYEKEEAEFILEFYQEMLRQMKTALDEDYKDLKEKIGTKKMRKLAKRVRAEDYDSL